VLDEIAQYLPRGFPILDCIRRFAQGAPLPSVTIFGAKTIAFEESNSNARSAQANKLSIFQETVETKFRDGREWWARVTQQYFMAGEQLFVWMQQTGWGNFDPPMGLN
jgi:hypothetical protein